MMPRQALVGVRSPKRLEAGRPEIAGHRPEHRKSADFLGFRVWVFFKKSVVALSLRIEGQGLALRKHTLRKRTLGTAVD